VEIAKGEADGHVTKLIRMLQSAGLKSDLRQRGQDGGVFGPSAARGIAPGRFIGEDHTERGGAMKVLRQCR
jgi:hypothetical protein